MKAYIKIIITIIAFTACTLGVIYFSSSNRFKVEKITFTTPVPKSIRINLDENLFQNIIDHPESSAVKLTLVTLKPEEHRLNKSDEQHEVMIVTLAGNGIVKIKHKEEKDEILNISTRDLAYCPPGTAFDIIDSGTETLKYLYIIIGK